MKPQLMLSRNYTIDHGRIPFIILAMILIQALALNQISMLANTYIYYDTGDAWDKGADRVAYRHHMRFFKNDYPTVNSLKTEIMKNHAFLVDHDLAEKLHATIIEVYSEPYKVYFDSEDFSRTCGVIIGYKGWQEITTMDVINLLIASLQIRVISGSDFSAP